MQMFRNKSVDVHSFAMIPHADVPRSSFRIQKTHKTTFDPGLLIPVYCAEVLPGDTFNLNMVMFARMSTPIFPIMDNMYLTSFFFFVPNRLVWPNWRKFMGEQDNPGDSISYTVPTTTCPASGYAVNSIFDYFGLPTVGQVGAGNTITHNCLPLRAYMLIYDQWFRDENLQNSAGTYPFGDGPDTYTNFSLQRRGKRKDYFTSSLPWPQKGATPVSLPIGTSATVKTSATELFTGAQQSLKLRTTAGSVLGAAANLYGGTDGNMYAAGAASGGSTMYPTNLYADLSTATASTINQIRQAFQIQKLLERDARGGTRYTEIIQSHFRVKSPDARLQRPEYLGGNTQAITISPIAQTAQTGLTGGNTALGTLAAMGTVVSHRNGFTQSFVEHGYIIGLVSIQADLTYQQGLQKHWNRSTRYDYYWPAFATLGEQAVLNREIYCDGSANDTNVFGYAERWAEYRYDPSMITGQFRSTYATPLDAWHMAQKFTTLPTLNSTFISDTPPITRVIAVGAAATGASFIYDSFIDLKIARPMPMFSVPGLIDHF